MNNMSFLKIYTQWEELNTHNIIDFDKYNEILFTYHTTSIEGSSLTLEETSLLITDGLTAKSKFLTDHLMVCDHHRALAFVMEQAKHDAAITPVFIQNINALVMKSTGGIINTPLGSFDSSKGVFRKCTVRAGDKLFMDPQKVPAAVDKFCEQIYEQSDTKDEILKIYNIAFQIHLKLVLIHPFADGNGRTSRLLMNYILIRQGLPLAIVYNEDKPDYLAALRQSDKTGDVNIFNKFMFSQQEKYLLDQINLFKDQSKNDGDPNFTTT